jgi:hypothetical protein
MEEVRQREANLTALAAIGPRRQRRTDTTPGLVMLFCITRPTV